MPKRVADVELNQDNWDDDLPAITPKEVPQSDNKTDISGRKILVAKSRRASTATGLFKSLSGFSSNTPAAPTFSFGVTPPFSNSNHSTPPSTDLNQETEYLKELQTLNHNLLEWIDKHVKADPHCILSPVFTDYEKHLKHLHEKYPKHKPSDLHTTSTSITSFTSTLPTPPVNGSFKTSQESTVTAKPGLQFPSFSQITQSSTSDSKPAFSFSLPPLTSNNSQPALFKFGDSFPSSSPFTSQSAPANTATVEDDENEEYQPPKPVVREIKEEGSVYTVRCKLFYKADSEWRERGVGNLFIKPQSDDKFQLLVRADTTLGNILLNVMITKDIPVHTQKNNLTLVCVPTPPLPSTKKGDETPKPSLMLIRVKTEEAANELLKQIDQHRGLNK